MNNGWLLGPVAASVFMWLGTVTGEAAQKAQPAVVVMSGDSFASPEPISPDVKDCTDRRTATAKMQLQAKVLTASEDVVAVDLQTPPTATGDVYVAPDDRRAMFVSPSRAGRRTLLFADMFRGPHRIVFATGVSERGVTTLIDAFAICFNVAVPVTPSPE